MTERDIKILCFIAIFGKSYSNVIAKTFFAGVKNSEQVAKNRIRLLVNKYKVLDYKLTGLQSPRNYLTLTEAGREVVVDFGYSTIKTPHFSLVTVKHNMVEQIVFYWIDKVRETQRTTVKTHSKTNFHTPDLLFFTDSGKKVYVEIELTKKTASNYQDIFAKITKDEAEIVLYVTDSEDSMKRLAKVMPVWDRLRFTTVDRLIESVSNEQKISSLKQIELIGV